MKLSQDELSARIQNAKNRIQVGGTYHHYKAADMLYEVKDIVINEADNEPYVVYQALYGQKVTFVRPVKVWLQKVEVDSRLVPRFTRA